MFLLFVASKLSLCKGHRTALLATRFQTAFGMLHKVNLFSLCRSSFHVGKAPARHYGVAELCPWVTYAHLDSSSRQSD